MEAPIIAAIIGGVVTLAAAGLALAKKNGDSKGNHVENRMGGDVSGSNVAAGSNITQTVNNYHGALATERVASKPSLIEIAETIRKAKPFDKIQISKNYNGIEISWLVRFNTVREGEESGMWYVSFVASLGHSPFVSAYIDIERWPKLRVIEEGHLCWIAGRICWADEVCVHLQPNLNIDIQ